MFDHPASLPILILLLTFVCKAWIGRAVQAVLIALVRWPRRWRYGRWQGKYFAFGDQQVRMCLHAGVIWVAADDVRALLAPPPTRIELKAIENRCGRIPGQRIDGITESGVLRLLALRTGHRRASHEMVLLERWFVREAFPNLHHNPSGSM